MSTFKTKVNYVKHISGWFSVIEQCSKSHSSYTYYITNAEVQILRERKRPTTNKTETYLFPMEEMYWVALHHDLLVLWWTRCPLSDHEIPFNDVVFTFLSAKRSSVNLLKIQHGSTVVASWLLCLCIFMNINESW